MKRKDYIARGLVAAARLFMGLGWPGFALAKRLLSAAVARQGPRGPAAGWLAYCRSIEANRRGNHAQAMEQVRIASDLLPNEPGPAVAMALAWANLGEWQRAAEAAERALKFHEEASGAPALWQVLAWAHLIAGRYPMVIELLQRMRDAGMSADPIHLPVLLATAVMSGHVPLAELRPLLRRNPRALPPYTQFIEALSRSGKRDAVAHQLLAALPPPSAVATLEFVARVAEEEGAAERLVWAAEALRRLELAPERAMAMAAMAAAMAGNFDAAREYLQQATALGPDEPSVHVRAARVWLICGQVRQALSSATRAIMLGSPDALCAGMVALRLLEDGEPRKARRIFVAQRSGDAPGALLAHLAQAAIFAEYDEFDDAVRVLGMAVEEARDLPAWAANSLLPGLCAAALARIEQTCAGQQAVLDAARRVREAIEARAGRAPEPVLLGGPDSPADGAAS